MKIIKDPFVERFEIKPYGEGSLTGLTFAVKDNIDVAGYKTGYGSPGWADTHHNAVANAVIIDQLLGAGARFSGKTCLDELAYSLSGINHFSGTPLNPKAPDRVPGGSSSGSASAVALGEVDFAIGTDTGGSVRVPAANCGVWGYRPSHGVISSSGVLPLAPSFDAVGIFSQSGEILERVVKSILSEKEFDDRELTVCFLDDFFSDAEKGIKERLNPCLKEISKNFKVRSTGLQAIAPGTTSTWLFEILGFLLSSEIWNTFGSWATYEKPQLSPEVETNLNKYAKLLDRKKIWAKNKARFDFKNKVDRFLSAGNIICFPTILDFPPKISESSVFEGDYTKKAMGVNALSGLSKTPQITIPVVSDGEIPAGLSFMAGFGDDLALVKFCNRIFNKVSVFSGT